jgi:hypothetical protein
LRGGRRRPLERPTRPTVEQRSTRCQPRPMK